AEIGRPLAVDDHEKLRLGEVGGKPGLLEARVLFELRDDRQGGRVEFLVVAADDRELQPGARAADAEAVGLEGERAHAVDRGNALLDVGQDLLLCARALLPWCQRQHHEARVLRTPAARYRERRADLAG